jgi:predicted anti-sigma-YlaC factor YlaD
MNSFTGNYYGRNLAAIQPRIEGNHLSAQIGAASPRFAGLPSFWHRLKQSRTMKASGPTFRFRSPVFGWLALFVAFTLGSGCSIKRFAVNKVGDALAAGGTTFSSDDDPELIKAAVPFSLKLMESLLAESPRHQGLLFATASGFTQYGYAFVQLEAEELEATDFAGAKEKKARAKRLYLRGRNYGLRGLETKHPGFTNELRKDSRLAVAAGKKSDVPMLYWTAASWAAAISVSKDDPELIGDLPLVAALIDRALALDESWDHGAIHSFLITFEMARQDASGDAESRARQHFARAIELSGGKLAAPYVALAEAVAVKKQDADEFKKLLEQALAINPDAQPDSRLANLIMQRRARWLLAHTDEYFLLPEKESTQNPEKRT